MTLTERINNAVQASFVGRYFEMEERKATFFAELRGATATFMSMAYILAVNPRILSDSGGPCVPNEDDGGIFGDTYLNCQQDIKREYVTSTAIGSLFGCLAMGLLANLPVALAPGMGMVSLAFELTSFLSPWSNRQLRMKHATSSHFFRSISSPHRTLTSLILS